MKSPSGLVSMFRFAFFQDMFMGVYTAFIGSETPL